MAHECPECGLTCYCGGDIDDICWGEQTGYCKHCDEDDDFDEDEYYEQLERLNELLPKPE